MPPSLPPSSTNPADLFTQQLLDHMHAHNTHRWLLGDVHQILEGVVLMSLKGVKDESEDFVPVITSPLVQVLGGLGLGVLSDRLYLTHRCAL